MIDGASACFSFLLVLLLLGRKYVKIDTIHMTAKDGFWIVRVRFIGIGHVEMALVDIMGG